MNRSLERDMMPFFYFSSAKETDETIRVLEQICQEGYKEEETTYYNFGYETFGMILYGFGKWLIQDLASRNIKKVLFCSRDGYILMKAFELIPGHESFDKDYIYVSRKSLRIPLLHFAEPHERTKIIFSTRYISIYDLLNSIGLTPEKYETAILDSGLTFQTIIKDEDVESDKRVTTLLDSIWEDVKENSTDEYNEARKYLEKLKLDGDVAIVDIGWRGSIQYYLQMLLDQASTKPISLQGYYVNLSSSMIKNQSMRGYLNNIDENSEGCDLLRGYIGLIELMFLKTEGSTRKYMNSKPVLDKYEYLDSSGRFTEEVNAVKDIQRGALSFVRDAVVSNGTEINYSSETAFYNLNQFGNHPTFQNVKLFDKFRFFNNGTVSFIAGEHGLLYFIAHPRALKRELYESRWRLGFFKRVLKIPFPYYALFKLMLKKALKYPKIT